MSDINIWGIHAGAKGEAVDLFINEKVMALSWPLAGDVSILFTRDEFKKQFTENHKSHPTYSHKRSADTAANILYNFVWDLKINDIVIFYFGKEYKYYLGQVTGDYYFVPSDFPHRRQVNWITYVLKSTRSKNFKNSMGSGVPLFSMSKYKDEIYAIPTFSVTLV